MKYIFLPSLESDAKLCYNVKNGGDTMELLQLKYFSEAAKSQNFSKTAEKFTVPPSAISQSIRRLENELGTPLFDRSANRLHLNADGARFYESVTAALELLETAKKQIRTGNTVKVLNICVNCNRRIVMQAMERFKAEYPDVTVCTVHFGTPAEAYDLVITSDPSTFTDYRHKALLTEQIALAVHRSHRLAKQKEPLLSELAAEPFITLRHGGEFYKMTEEICRKAGFSPRVAIETDDPFYLRKCVELGLGVSFVPVFSWDGQFSNDVSLLPLKEHMRTTYVCTPKNTPTPKPVTRLIEMLGASVAE
jgi:DNA-binding transcriptional LysR family regulator